jgi:hypothetical protein
MGCDIHSFIEYKEKGLGSWRMLYFTGLYLDRVYYAFNLMAGVRASWNVAPLFETRGLPVDITGEVARKFREWGDDAHTPSWLGTAEFSRVVVSLRKKNGGVVPLTYSAIEAVLKSLEAEGAEARIVFWFDN